MKTSSRWWPAPKTRASAMEDAQYYMWYGNPSAAFEIIVALCATINQQGHEKYDEDYEHWYTTAYQRAS